VNEYVIYRASGNNVQEAINFTAYHNALKDTFYKDNAVEAPVNCYYILANELATNNTSKSNIVCYIKEGRVYYPNALTRYGTNIRFTFIGEGIDLSQSSIQIYNRWGMLEYSKDDISAGWLGTNNNGDTVPSGVYFFMAQIMVGNEKIQLNGNITVIQ
jgi:gliding motility-associated-like protein